MSTKSYFVISLFLCIVVVITIVNLFGGVRIKPGNNNLNLIYNSELYISSYDKNDEILQHYRSSIKQNVIKNLDRLIIESYTFKPKDTLHTIAKSFGTNVESIRSTNYIEAVGLLYPGQRLTLHNKRGMLYKVKKGDTVQTIAKKFKKSPEELLLVNDKPGIYTVSPGEYIFLPDTYIKFKDFMFPLSGTRITSGFGLRVHPIFNYLKFHEGIDLKQRYGAPVRAACDGKVIYAGWAEGYGKLVILKHHKGYTTYYGHLSKIRVKPGQFVHKGRIIGNVGTTGWTTGPHLHFEVRKNGVPINPKKVLF